MEILKYEYRDHKNGGWRFAPMEFGKINLFVGNSGMGKTRLLNTLFNLASAIASKKIRPGGWDLTVLANKNQYNWSLIVEREHDSNRAIVSYELLEKISNNGTKDVLIKRELDSFVFMNQELPKLSKTESSISLLLEEEEIKPLFDGISKVTMRRFFRSDLSELCELAGGPVGFLDEVAKGKTDPRQLFPTLQDGNIGLNGVLYILHKYFKNVYYKICELYKQVFTDIIDIEMMEARDLPFNVVLPGHVPVFCIKKKM